MITILNLIADVLLVILVFIYDRRIAELEDRTDELETRLGRLRRKLARPYG